MIYFIGNLDQDICKIGYSKRPYRRIKGVQNSVPYPLYVLDIIVGELEDEQLIHALNDKARIKGEWYRLSEVKSLDISNKAETLKIGGIILIRDKQNYFHLTTLIGALDKIRLSRNRNKFNFSQWVKSNKIFIDSHKAKGIVPIKKGHAYWVHPYITIDIMRTDPVTKLIAYENMFKIMTL